MDMPHTLSITRRVPTEVWENVIDMLQDFFLKGRLQCVAALQSCSLVCTAWRPRAQIMLFSSIHLFDVPTLHKFVSILDSGPHLGSYVREVSLIGPSLHTTTSIVTLFPVILGGKLPNLQGLYVTPVLDSAGQFPKTSSAHNGKPLQCIPLHPRFPILLSSFTAISYIYLQGNTFRSFSEFARMIHSLPNLRSLVSVLIKWIAFGPSPAFMRPALGDHNLPHFAPKLRDMILSEISADGVERLISACGSQLTKLWVSMPLCNNPNESRSVIDLSSCSELDVLTIMPGVGLLTNQCLTDLKSTLASWTPQTLAPCLTLNAWENAADFTRQEFAGILRTLGTIVEDWLQTIQAASATNSTDNTHNVKYGICIRMYDWECQREWWRSHVRICFPRWVKLGQLWMIYKTPINEGFEWKPDGKALSMPVLSDVDRKPPGPQDGSSPSPKDMLSP